MIEKVRDIWRALVGTPDDYNELAELAFPR